MSRPLALRFPPPHRADSGWGVAPFPLVRWGIQALCFSGHPQAPPACTLFLPLFLPLLLSPLFFFFSRTASSLLPPSLANPFSFCFKVLKSLCNYMRASWKWSNMLHTSWISFCTEAAFHRKHSRLDATPGLWLRPARDAAGLSVLHLVLLVSSSALLTTNVGCSLCRAVLLVYGIHVATLP